MNTYLIGALALTATSAPGIANENEWLSMDSEPESLRSPSAQDGETPPMFWLRKKETIVVVGQGPKPPRWIWPSVAISLGVALFHEKISQTEILSNAYELIRRWIF